MGSGPRLALRGRWARTPHVVEGSEAEVLALIVDHNHARAQRLLS